MPGEAKSESILTKVRQYPVDAYLFDTYKKDSFGGTGEAFNWDVLKGQRFEKKIILSGGLNPYNVSEAVETVQPFAVDVSSGVEEKPGIKSKKLLTKFFKAIRHQSSAISR